MTNSCRGNTNLLVVWLILSCALLPLAGCGEGSGPTGTVVGNVVLDGEPYSGAAVVFFNSGTGQVGMTNIQSDGSFKIAQPIPVGSYVVYLAPEIADVDDANATGAELEQSVYMTGNDTVPDKYWNEAETDLTFEISEGSNTVTVELKKEG